MGINSITGKVINSGVKKFLVNKLEFARKEPVQFAADMMVLSLVSKDAVNCVMYTYQSYNNKKIPEENRIFCAALDFVQGLLNIGTQLFAASVIKKHLTPMMFKSLIENKLLYTLSEEYSKQLVKKLPNVKIKDIEKEVQTHLGENSMMHKATKGGFELLMTLLATTALCKRTLVPLIATPIASRIKCKLMNGSTSATQNNNNAATGFPPMASVIAQNNANALQPLNLSVVSMDKFKEKINVNA